MKRLLDCEASDLVVMSKQEKLDAMAASEGRVFVSEIGMFRTNPQLDYISDAEVASAFGADMLLLNIFDVYNPHVPGIQVENPAEVIQTLKKYTGRMIGVNLEPVDETKEVLGKKLNVKEGRQASVKTAKRAVELGFDFILLTGNPGTGVTNEKILELLKEIHAAVGDQVIIMAGKMHAAGSKHDAATNILTKPLIKEFAQAGADIILFPAPGTVPGIQLDYATELVNEIHKQGCLSLSAIGTSQEGASKETIEQIALMCKMSGTDLHHIGDAGVGGVCAENIMYYNIAIKGKRHTYLRMARSVNR